ncbi:hypothetical protein KFU94_14450 [Chloroflexi bacterium TSY]|nr:hypothetical protein [Chloroflexi bacterium TSY]
MTPEIENPAQLELSTDIRQVLSQMFSNYGRIILQKEFKRGLSGGHVFEIKPIKADSTPELPVVVKLSTVSQIQKEWQAFDEHIRRRVLDIPNVFDAPSCFPIWGGAVSAIA